MKQVNRTLVINSIKMILAAVIAIWAASALKLDFAISAGVVAILTIQPTKKETIRLAAGRLCAFAVALMLAYVCFKLLGYTINAFILYLMIYIIICQMLSWNNALTMNSVLISHFVTHGVMDRYTVGNEASIFVIGVSCGIIANLHLRKRVDYIESLKKATDEQMIKILSRMSDRIMNKDISDYNGECFNILRKHIRKAKNVAEENYNNQFGSGDTSDMEYIAMRDKQCQILYEMYKSIRKMNTSPHTAGAISEFLRNMAGTLKLEDNREKLMEQFREMDVYMKSQPLPVERKEFEDRARLFGLMRSIEEFIMLK